MLVNLALNKDILDVPEAHLTNTIEKINDGVTESSNGYLVSRSGVNPTILIDLENPVRVHSVTLHNFKYGSQYRCQDFDVVVKNNEGEVVVVQSGELLPIEDGQSFNINSGERYRYWGIRINSIENNGPSSRGIREVELWGRRELSLLKLSKKIYTFLDSTWIDLQITGTPTKSDFETHGMDDLSIIPKEKLDGLTKPYSILTWTDNQNVAIIDLNYTYGEHETKWLYTNTNPFSPLDRLNEEDEFEVLTYSDEVDEVPTTTVSEEDTIDSGKLFTATIDDFDIVTGVEVR